ncbi:MAG: PP2C family protein-serine/threonine phosphatase [Bacteroidia bacterium]
MITGYFNGETLHQLEEKCLEKKRQYQTKVMLDELIKEKTESMRYAALIQEAISHDPESLKELFPQSFVYNSPKDIVSGDFKWFEKAGDKVFLAVADCTGHGVPGAMLSILGIGKLHSIVKSGETQSPAGILDRLNKDIYTALGKKNGHKKMHDGMDIAFFSVDLKTNVLEFSGANNGLCIIRNGVLFELKADKQDVGSTFYQKPFTNHSFQLRSGDMVYGFSDGYKDQFGGTKGKKFTSLQLKELLVSISHKDSSAQKNILHETLVSWKGELEQVDDILIMGLRV